MKRCFLHVASAVAAAALALPAIAADVLPGATVAERALNGAKEHIEQHGGAENLKLTMLPSSLYRNSMPDFTREWTELAGVEIENVPLGYTDIPSTVMAEATAKTGVYDTFSTTAVRRVGGVPCLRSSSGTSSRTSGRASRWPESTFESKTASS